MKFEAGNNLTSIYDRFTRIRQESRQQVRPRDFWIGVGTAVALLGAMGVYFLQTGHVPVFPAWLRLATLLLIWGTMLVNVLRYGRLVYSPGQLAALFGFTLFAAPFLHKPSWVENAGFLVMMAGNFWSMGDARNQPAPVPPVDPQCA